MSLITSQFDTAPKPAHDTLLSVMRLITSQFDTAPKPEIKTPSSGKKVADRLVDAAEQFDPYPEEPRRAIVSLLRLKGDYKAAEEKAAGFVKDGTFRSIAVVLPDSDHPVSIE